MRTIRPLRENDRDAVYEICLRTGRAGEDATDDYSDPLLIGHVWAGPYVALEPQHGFVVVGADDRPRGYVLGARDTRRFEARLEAEWLPPLRTRYPLDFDGTSDDRACVRMLHRPPRAIDSVVAEYPSHLHIDLLPDVQGQGEGRRLIDTLIASLATAGSSGVHLGVSAQNERAVGFYRALGFTELLGNEHGYVFGRPIRQETP